MYLLHYSSHRGIFLLIFVDVIVLVLLLLLQANLAVFWASSRCSWPISCSSWAIACYSWVDSSYSWTLDVYPLEDLGERIPVVFERFLRFLSCFLLFLSDFLTFLSECLLFLSGLILFLNICWLFLGESWQNSIVLQFSSMLSYHFFNACSSPTFLFSNIWNLISIKLNSQNYILWKSQFLPVLRAHGLISFMDGSHLCPPELLLDSAGNPRTDVNPQFLTWTQQDQNVLCWINATLFATVLVHVVGLQFARDAWIALEKRFTSLSRSSII